MSQKPYEEDDPSQHKKKKKVKKRVSGMHPLLKIVLIFLLIILSVIIMYYGKPLLLPLTVAAILAMMVNPLMNRMLNIGLPRWLTITLLALMLVVIGSGISFLFGQQIGVVSQDWPEIQKRLLSLGDDLKDFMKQTFNAGPSFLKNQAANKIPFGGLITGFIGSLSRVISDGFLVLIYFILMLMARNQFRKLFLRLSKEESKEDTAYAIDECVKVSSKFLFGRLIIVALVIGIYCLGFWLGDVPYFFFLALLAGLLSIIPFLGNIIGGIITCILAFVTGGVISLVVVVGVIIIGQLIGDYVLTPWILGEVIRLNPFMTILSVITFTILWGPVGAIFALPLVAMLRILFERRKATLPYAEFLVGDR